MGERMDDEQQRAERSSRKVALVVCGVVWVLTCTFVCVCVCVCCGCSKRNKWQEKAREVSDHVNLVIASIEQLAALQ